MELAVGILIVLTMLAELLSSSRLFPVLVASSVSFVLAFFWFSFWSDVFVRNLPKPPKFTPLFPLSLAVAFFNGFLMIYIQDALYLATGARGYEGGLHSGFWLWLGFVFVPIATHFLFTNEKLPRFAVEVFRPLVSYLICGLVLASFAHPSSPHLNCPHAIQIALALATVARFLINMGWWAIFSDSLLGLPKKENGSDHMPLAFLWEFVGSFLTVYIISHLFVFFGGDSVFDGAVIGLVFTLLISVQALMSHYIFGAEGFAMFAFESAGLLMSTLAAGAIIGAYYS